MQTNYFSYGTHLEAFIATQSKEKRPLVILCHNYGYNDPIADQEELHRFEKEMTEAKVDWQAHLFGNTFHGFALTSANDPAAGIFCNPLSAERVWRLAKDFLHEVIS